MRISDWSSDVCSSDLVGIWFGAVIRADNTAIVVGDRTNIQEGAMLHSDPGFPLALGVDCTIGHHAILHGCTIGDRVLVGMGATVLNGAVIGDDCLIGAGALVTERSEEHTSELQSLMRISYAVFCLKKKRQKNLE